MQKRLERAGGEVGKRYGRADTGREHEVAVLPEAGEPDDEDLVGLVRELNRFFRVSMPDDRLSEYV